MKRKSGFPEIFFFRQPKGVLDCLTKRNLKYLYYENDNYFFSDIQYYIVYK